LVHNDSVRTYADGYSNLRPDGNAPKGVKKELPWAGT